LINKALSFAKKIPAPVSSSEEEDVHDSEEEDVHDRMEEHAHDSEEDDKE
jgi:hypothetical protein